MDTNKITERILELANSKAVVTVGIDGLGGAGKSTVSEDIVSELEKAGVHTVLLHIDDFITNRAFRYNNNYSPWKCYYYLQWRYDYLRKVTDKLKVTGKAVEVELYDKDNDSYITVEYCTKERTVILIEGIFLQRKELDGVFDLMAYIDVPEDERLERVLKRDTYIGDDAEIRAKYETRYFPAERRYVSEYSPAGKADLLLG